jgi:hypothetical protein
MRLNLSKSHTIKGGSKPIQARSHKTTVNNTIFRIVTKGLYIRPIEAIVREISTNALDGHIAIGKADVPFEVTLPNTLSPYFKVRDFGCSMDNDTVFNVYGVLGESTKNATSDSIGGWGVGGKSPAAYTDTFFIHTYKDGIRRIYQSSCLQNSTPLELLLEGITDEPDGVEVKVPVRVSDFDKFRRAASSQLAAFDVKPIIIHDSLFTYDYDLATAPSFDVERTLLVPDNEGNLVDKTLNIKIFESLLQDSLAVRMGCVVYPINTKSSYYEDYKKTLESIAKVSGVKSLLVDLPVDTVDIKPSREDLDYTERTNDVLNIVMNKLLKHYRKVAISVAFQARHMPYDEAVKYITENCTNQGMRNYIWNRYTNTSPFGVRDSYADTSYTFNRLIRKGLQNACESHPTHVSTDFSCYAYEKVSSFTNSRVSYQFDEERTLNIILKSPSYIKRIDYWISEDVDVVPSGLYSSTQPNRRPYYDPTDVPKSAYTQHSRVSSTYLCMTQLQIDVFLDTFKKFYKNVNVLTLDAVPKDVVKTRTFSNYTSLKTFDLVFHGMHYDTPKTRTWAGTYSLRSIKEIIEAYGSTGETYFYRAEGLVKTQLLSETAKFLGVTVCSISMPDSLASKVIPKGLVHSFGALHDFLLGKISKVDKLKLVEDYVDARIIEDVRYYARVDSLTSIFLSKDTYEAVVPYFFKFLPKTKPIIKYVVLAKFLMSYSQGTAIVKGKLLLEKRLKARTKLMLIRKPTLTLLNTYSPTPVIIQLLQLNFKGFNTNANT